MSGAEKRIRLDAKAHPLMEERLQEEEEDRRKSLERPRLPLKKDGGEVDLVMLRAREEHLRDLLEGYPEYYRALRALVEGRVEEVSEQQFLALRSWGYLALDRTPHPDIQAIMKAADRDTPDGPCLVEPLEVRTPEVAATVQEFDEQLEKRHKKGMGRLLKKLREQDDGPAF